MVSSSGREDAEAAAVGAGGDRLTLGFKVRLEFEDLRCLLGGTSQWISPSAFFVPTPDPVEPGHVCRFEIGVGRRGPWIEGEGEVARAVRLASAAEPTGMEVCFSALTEDGSILLTTLFEAAAQGPAALEAAVGVLVARAEADVPTLAMPSAADTTPGDDTAPALDTDEHPIRESTLVLEDPRPAAAAEVAPVDDGVDRKRGSWGWGLTIALLVGLAAAWFLWNRFDRNAAAGNSGAVAAAATSSAVAEPVAAAPVEQVAVEAVRWERSGAGLDVDVIVSGDLAEGTYRHYRLEIEGGPPRELLKIFGGQQTFEDRFFPVGDNFLSQIRTGSHLVDGTQELHVVFDVADPSVRLVLVSRTETGLRARFEQETVEAAETVTTDVDRLPSAP